MFNNSGPSGFHGHRHGFRPHNPSNPLQNIQRHPNSMQTWERHNLPVASQLNFNPNTNPNASASFRPRGVERFNNFANRPQSYMNPGHVNSFQQNPPLVFPNSTSRPAFQEWKGANVRMDNSQRNNSWHNRSNNQKKKPNKQKVDKRELAENNVFFCDTCDRGFKTEDIYLVHVNGHTKCTVKGCSYIAAPKLVKLHYDLQHKSGMAKRIWSADSPEDINKWIEERKKNYPTAENVSRKNALDAEKRARGEVIETKFFGKFKHGKNSNQDSSAHNNRQNNRKRNRKNKWQNKNDQTEEMNEAEPNIKKIKPCDEEPSTSTNGPNPRENNSCEMSLSHEASTSTSDSVLNHKEQDDGRELDGTCPPEKSSHLASKCRDEMVVADRTSTRRKRKIPNKEKLFAPNKSSLLEKLLAKEIRHERNIILQCVHHIVKKKFFGASPTSNESSNKQTKDVVSDGHISDSSDDSGVAMEKKPFSTDNEHSIDATKKTSNESVSDFSAETKIFCVEGNADEPKNNSVCANISSDLEKLNDENNNSMDCESSLLENSPTERVSAEDSETPCDSSIGSTQILVVDDRIIEITRL